MKKRGSLKKVGRRLAKVAVVLLAAAAVMLVLYELKGSDDKEIAGPPPVQVRVLAPGSFDSPHPYAPYYVVPDKRVASPAKLSTAAANRFVTRPEAALAKGAQAGSPQIVRLMLRSTTDDPVTVEGVSFDVVSDARPLKGWFTAQPACSSGSVRFASVTLDSKRRQVRYVDPPGGASRALSLPLKRSGFTVLELRAATKRHRVAWTAALSISRDGGRPQTLTVDDGGQPFRVTSARASRGYAPRFGATGISGFIRDRSWDGGRITGC
jgi:hypothetical protein